MAENLIFYKNSKPSIEQPSFIADNAMIIGDVSIGSYSSVWFGAVLRGDIAPISLGSYSNVQDLSVIHVNPDTPVKIGSYVTIGHHCILHGCTIGDNSLIGMGSIVMDEAYVPNDCIVAAGSLITQKSVFPERSLIMGRPARVKRPITADEIESNRQLAKKYCEIMQLYIK